MRRKLFALAALVSGATFAIVLAVWVRGAFVTDVLYWQSWDDDGEWSYWHQHAVFAGQGAIAMNVIVQSGPKAWFRQRMAADAKPFAESFHSTRPASERLIAAGSGPWPGWGGLRRGVYAPPEPGQTRPAAYWCQLVLPYKVLLPICAALPIAWAWRRRHGRYGPGCCRRCGYDLRATPGRCPECGTIPKLVKGAT